MTDDIRELVERLERQPCDCRPSRKPHGLDALFPQTHEADCSYRVAKTAAARLEAAEKVVKAATDSFCQCGGTVDLLDAINIYNAALPEQGAGTSVERTSAGED